MIDRIDLDLSAAAPGFVSIKGQSGEVFRIELWVPLSAMLAHAQRYEVMRGVGADELAKHPELLIEAFSTGYDIAALIFRKTHPEMTREEIEREFPNEKILALIGFLFQRYMSDGGPLKSPEASVTAETQTPKPISRQPKPRTDRTGSTSSKTLSTGRRAR